MQRWRSIRSKVHFSLLCLELQWKFWGWVIPLLCPWLLHVVISARVKTFDTASNTADTAWVAPMDCMLGHVNFDQSTVGRRQIQWTPMYVFLDKCFKNDDVLLVLLIKMFFTNICTAFYLANQLNLLMPRTPFFGINNRSQARNAHAKLTHK